MGLRTSRLSISVLVTLFLASPCLAAAEAERAPAEPLRALVSRVATWLVQVGERLASPPAEARGKRRHRPPKPEAFVDGPVEMGPSADPYG